MPLGAPGWQCKATALQRLRQSEAMPHWYVGDTASDGEAADQGGGGPEFRLIPERLGSARCAAPAAGSSSATRSPAVQGR